MRGGGGVLTDNLIGGKGTKWGLEEGDLIYQLSKGGGVGRGYEGGPTDKLSGGKGTKRGYKKRET